MKKRPPTGVAKCSPTAVASPNDDLEGFTPREREVADQLLLQMNPNDTSSNVEELHMTIPERLTDMVTALQTAMDSAPAGSNDTDLLFGVMENQQVKITLLHDLQSYVENWLRVGSLAQRSIYQRLAAILVPNGSDRVEDEEVREKYYTYRMQKGDTKEQARTKWKSISTQQTRGLKVRIN